MAPTISSTMTKLITACLIVAAVIVVAPPAVAAMTCDDIIWQLTPCAEYMMNNGNMAVPAACCAGIRTLNGQATTAPDRQTVCQCLKSVANSFPNVNMGLVGDLPAKCGVNLPYKIDPSVDCAKVK